MSFRGVCTWFSVSEGERQAVNGNQLLAPELEVKHKSIQFASLSSNVSGSDSVC